MNQATVSTSPPVKLSENVPSVRSGDMRGPLSNIQWIPVVKTEIGMVCWNSNVSNRGKYLPISQVTRPWSNEEWTNFNRTAENKKIVAGRQDALHPHPPTTKDPPVVRDVPRHAVPGHAVNAARIVQDGSRYTVLNDGRRISVLRVPQPVVPISCRANTAQPYAPIGHRADRRSTSNVLSGYTPIKPKPCTQSSGSLTEYRRPSLPDGVATDSFKQKQSDHDFTINGSKFRHGWVEPPLHSVIANVGPQEKLRQDDPRTPVKANSALYCHDYCSRGSPPTDQNRLIPRQSKPANCFGTPPHSPWREQHADLKDAIRSPAGVPTSSNSSGFEVHHSNTDKEFLVVCDSIDKEKLHCDSTDKEKLDCDSTKKEKLVCDSTDREKLVCEHSKLDDDHGNTSKCNTTLASTSTELDSQANNLNNVGSSNSEKLESTSAIKSVTNVAKGRGRRGRLRVKEAKPRQGRRSRTMSKFRERQKKRATSKESPPRSRRSSPLVFPHNHSERLHRVAACQWCKKLSQEDPNAWAALQEATLAPPTAEISKSDAKILEDFSITGFPLVELHDIMTSDDTRTERPTNLKGSQTEDADELSLKITQVINVLDPESQTGIEDTTNMDSSGKQGRLDTIIEKLHERLAPPMSMMTTSGTFRLT